MGFELRLLKRLSFPLISELDILPCHGKVNWTESMISSEEKSLVGRHLPIPEGIVAQGAPRGGCRLAPHTPLHP